MTQDEVQEVRELFLKADVINRSKKLANTYYKEAQIALEKLKPVIHNSELEFYENLLKFVLELQGSGLFGTVLGKFFITLVDVAGLYILVGTLWLVAFVLITNLKISEIISNFISRSKDNIVENAEIKRKTKEEYVKQSQKLETQRLKEEVKIKKMHEKKMSSLRDERSDEKMIKARAKMEKRLQSEERANQKKLDEYDAMFTQSPTKSIVDKILKKASVPTKSELIEKKRTEQEQILKEQEKEEAFDMFDSAGYSFDNKYKSFMV